MLKSFKYWRSPLDCYRLTHHTNRPINTQPSSSQSSFHTDPKNNTFQTSQSSILKILDNMSENSIENLTGDLNRITIKTTIPNKLNIKAEPFVSPLKTSQKSEAIEKTPKIPKMTERKLRDPVPDGWLECSKFHNAIDHPNLPFIIIPIRAPLDKSIPSLNPDEEWTWDHIKCQIRDHVNQVYKKRCSIAGVFDLTATQIDSPKYYKGSQLYRNHKIFYNKVLVVTKKNGSGGKEVVIPKQKLFAEFNRKMDKTSGIVSKWGDSERTQPVVLVHCTHGINRTGLFICNYLVEACGVSGKTALEVFEKSRGEEIKYDLFKDYICGLKPEDRDNE